VEYKNESIRMFRGLQDTIRQYAIQSILRVGAAAPVGEPRAQGDESKNLIFSSAKDAPPRAANPNVVKVTPGKKEPGRNDPCPCGSGKKYKKCHGS